MKVDINDKVSVMCLSESEGKTGDITCGFQMYLNGAIIGCEISLLELQAGNWNPITMDNKLDARCSVVVDAQELKDTGDTGAEEELVLE
jgi:hypothetical protein